MTMSVIFKRTKILATLGPATNSAEMVGEMVAGGVNALRMNFSHGDYEERIQTINWARDASRQQHKIVAMLQDLQAPKIRVGNLNVDQLPVARGDEIVLQYGADHDGFRVPVQCNLAEKVQVGEPIYIFDGKIRTT